MHSNGCPYCCARFIRWANSSGRADKKELIESTLSYAEKWCGLTRDQIRAHYKAGDFHEPKPTSLETVLALEKPVKTKRRSVRKN